MSKKSKKHSKHVKKAEAKFPKSLYVMKDDWGINAAESLADFTEGRVAIYQLVESGKLTTTTTQQFEVEGE